VKKVKNTLKIKGLDLVYEGNDELLLKYLDGKAEYDEKFKFYRIKPIYYPKILKFCEKNHINITNLYENIKLERLINKKNYVLRDYQEKALKLWKNNNCNGIVVLATGAGKSFVGLEAIYEMQLKTLIIVPTIDLMEQWKNLICKSFSLPKDIIGIWGGGKHELKEITITTYDSCAKHIKTLRKDRGLVIYDEVHHLPAKTYRIAAEGVFAPYKLGLSATPERADELHLDLEYLVGSIVIRLGPDELDQNSIAEFEIKNIMVDLTNDERKVYDESMKIYSNYIKSRNIRMYSSKDFQKLVLRTGRDKKALEALKCRNKARQIAFNASNKLIVLEELLNQHKEQKVIIFSEFNEIIERIGKIFLIPIITHRTKSSERKIILNKFREGIYTKIASSRVLDEGISVSDASIGIILSGSSQKRQLVQRLGRLLRPYKTDQDIKKAVLYELISKNTIEKSTARRRSLKK